MLQQQAISDLSCSSKFFLLCRAQHLVKPRTLYSILGAYMDQQDRKTSLLARLEGIDGSLPLSSDDAPPPEPAMQTADTTAHAADGNNAQAPAPAKRRLPTWLTAPVPLDEGPSSGDAPALLQEQASRPKVSIRARAAAVDAAARGLTLSAATDLEILPEAAGAGAAAPAASTGLGAAGAAGQQQQRMNLATRLNMSGSFNRPAMTAQTALGSTADDASAAAARQEDATAGADAGANATATQPRPRAAKHAQPQQALTQQQQQVPDGDGAGPAGGALVSAGPDNLPHHAQHAADVVPDPDTLWESDSEAEQQVQHAPDSPVRQEAQHQQHQQQRQEQQQQEEEEPQELTLQQRQQRQMAQLGLKVPAAAGDDDADWLKEVFATAGSGGSRRAGGRSAGAGAAGGSGGGRSGGGGGSGGRRQGPSAAASGLPSPAVAPASNMGQGAAHAGPQQQQQQGGAGMQLAAGLQQDISPTAVSPADGEEAGVQHDPLVLFDAESNLRLQVPGSINQHLRSYQRQGVQFLFSRYAAGLGGVLADDMGLGKTCQSVAFIAALLGKQGTMQDALPRSFAGFRRQRRERRQQRQQLCADDDEQEEEEEEEEPAADASSAIRWPVLVVCPTSVLDNWVRELNMWGTFKVIKYHGPPAAREAIADEAAGGQYEVILTSYDTLRVDARALADLNPHAVIFDEAHKLKNSKSKQYEAAASLPTKYRYGLSGTIMQNDWDELFAVLDLLSPGCLGEYGGFVEYYSKPIKRGQSSTAPAYEVVKAEKRRRQLVDVVKQVTLRRTKAIIADQLPRKTDNVVFCQLQPLQYRAYDRTLASPDLQALRMAKSPCDCGSGLLSGQCCHSMVPASQGGVLWPHYHCCTCNLASCNRHRPYGCEEYYASQGYNNPRLRCPYCLMMPAISLLTKISNHLELIRPDAKLQEVDERQFEFELAVARMVLGPDADQLGGLLANSTGWLGASDETHCGKMATLKMLLGTWASDYTSHNKVLLFSHSTRCLDLLEAFVQRQGYDYVRLDGSTPQKNRQGICDEFNSRSSIFLLLMSTVAGGLGLNLTAANKVVVFDPSWNPAHDLQAQDRAYRLGQTRDVAVYRLVGTGTLEEAVYKRQIYKQQQSNMVIDGTEEPRYWEGVQGDTDKPGELWGLWNLLRFSGQTVETRDILQAYKGRHRQQLEQQLKDDAAQQQQEQQQGRQAAAGAETVLPVAAAAAPSSKPFKIVVLDQLVGSADDDPPLDSVLLAEAGDAAAGRGSKAKPRAKAASRKRRSSEDAGADGTSADPGQAAEAGAPAAADAADVGGIAGLEDAWCDEALLGGILDELLPADDAEGAPENKQQQQQRRKRRRGIVTDSDEEGGSEDGGMRGGAVAGDVQPGGQLAPVPEGDAEGDDDSGLGGSAQGWPHISSDSESAMSCGSMGDIVQQVDPVLAALEEQGAILHVHRHEKVLGSSRQPKAEQPSQRPPRKHRQRASQQQAPSQPAHQCPEQLSVERLVRRRPSEGFSCCSEAAASAASAAATAGCGAIASLAVWQGMDVVHMAEWLLQLTPEQRQQVLLMYSEDLD